MDKKLLHTVLTGATKDKRKKIISFVSDIGSIFENLKKSVNRGDKQGYLALRKNLNYMISEVNRFGSKDILRIYRDEYNSWSSFLKDCGYSATFVPKEQDALKRYKEWIQSFTANVRDYNSSAELFFKYNQRLVAYDVATPSVKEKIVKSIYNDFKEVKKSDTGRILLDATDEVHKVRYSELGIDQQARHLQNVLDKELGNKLKDGRINISNDKTKQRWYDLRIYAETWVSDMATDAGMRASFDICDDAGIDLVTIPKTQACCDLCRPFQGKIYSISGKHPKYPPLGNIVVPFHPRCEHQILPWPYEDEEEHTITQESEQKTTNIDKSVTESVTDTAEEIEKKKKKVLATYETPFNETLSLTQWTKEKIISGRPKDAEEILNHMPETTVNPDIRLEGINNEYVLAKKYKELNDKTHYVLYNKDDGLIFSSWIMNEKKAPKKWKKIWQQ